jgi:hypothetical protein
MARKFKSTITDWVAIPNMSSFDNVIWYYYDLYNAKDEYEGRISCRMVENSNDWEEITEKPILVTEDGYEAFELDNIWKVDSNGLNIVGNCPCKSNLTTLPERFKFFAYQENAEAYIEQHKPRYSNEDLNNLLVEVINRTRETKVNHNTVKDLIDNLKALIND